MMSDEFESSTGVLEPVEQTVVRPERRNKRKKQPRYHVLLWNDEHHSFEYVIAMMKQLFGHSSQQGGLIAAEVHIKGRAVCLTTTKEHAELKRDQIHAYGKDDLVKNCKGSMSASIEPEC